MFFNADVSWRVSWREILTFEIQYSIKQFSIKQKLEMAIMNFEIQYSIIQKANLTFKPKQKWFGPKIH